MTMRWSPEEKAALVALVQARVPLSQIAARMVAGGFPDRGRRNWGSQAHRLGQSLVGLVDGGGDWDAVEVNSLRHMHKHRHSLAYVSARLYRPVDEVKREAAKQGLEFRSRQVFADREPALDTTPNVAVERLEARQAAAQRVARQREENARRVREAQAWRLRQRCGHGAAAGA